ncbi:MAG: mannonate dehydratase [Chloroflexi bacterium]|nr:mannonate dehydratase [Chloroflexota bacterium]
MGEAGIPILHLYVSSVRAPTEEAERETFFSRLIDYYCRIVEQAERSNVRLATHTYNAPSRLIWNVETFGRILDAVPSPTNGVLFCTGKTQLAGDDMVETIRSYGQRIVLVHVRNVAGDYVPGTYEAEDRRELEVRFDLGDIDLLAVFRTLKEIDYRGPVFAEHYPSIVGDRVAGLAWTCGYLKALEATLGV